MPLSVLLQKQIEICLSPSLSVPQSPWSCLHHPQPTIPNKQSNSKQLDLSTDKNLLQNNPWSLCLQTLKRKTKISAGRNGALFLLLLCALPGRISVEGAKAHLLLTCSINLTGTTARRRSFDSSCRFKSSSKYITSCCNAPATAVRSPVPTSSSSSQSM